MLYALFNIRVCLCNPYNTTTDIKRNIRLKTRRLTFISGSSRRLSENPLSESTFTIWALALVG